MKNTYFSVKPDAKGSEFYGGGNSQGLSDKRTRYQGTSEKGLSDQVPSTNYRTTSVECSGNHPVITLLSPRNHPLLGSGGQVVTDRGEVLADRGDVVAMMRQKCTMWKYVAMLLAVLVLSVANVGMAWGTDIYVWDGNTSQTNLSKTSYTKDTDHEDGTTGFVFNLAGWKDALVDITGYTNYSTYGKSKGIQQGGSNQNSNNVKLVIPKGYTASVHVVYALTGSQPKYFGLNATTAVQPNGSNCSAWNVTVTSNTTLQDATINNLAAGTYYLLGNANNCVFAEIKVTLTAAASGCSAPTSPTNGASTSSSRVVSWTAPGSAPAGGYLVAYSSATSTAPGDAVQAAGTNGSYTVVAVAAGTTTATLSALSPSTTYNWWVRSKCGDSSFSSWVAGTEFTTDAPPCTDVDAPTSLSCTAQTQTSLTFGWTQADHASGYVASLWNNSSCTGDALSSQDLGDVATVTFSGLTAGTTYYCKVQSKGDGSTYCATGGTTSAASGTTSACTAISPTWSYPFSTVAVGITIYPTIGGNTGGGAVTYSSSATGKITNECYATAAGSATLTANVAANGIYCSGSVTSGTITVVSDQSGLITQTLTTGKNEWGTPSAPTTTDETNITSTTVLSATNLTISGNGNTNNGGQTAKITGMTTGSEGDNSSKYMQMGFTVKSGKQLNVSAIYIPVQPVSSDVNNFKAVLSDGETTITGTLTNSPNGKLTYIKFDSYGTVKGNVTLTLYAWGWTEGYRLGKSIVIDGEIEDSASDTYYLCSDFSGEWTETQEITPGSYVDVSLPEASYLKYKIKKVPSAGDATWYGRDGSADMKRANCSNWTLSSSGPDCYVRTDIAGTYRFAMSLNGSGVPVMTVTYPTGVAVTLNMNGGGDPDTWQAYTDGVIPVPGYSPRRDGYAFDGWYADAEGTEPWVWSTTVSSATTLYAKWSNAWYYAEEDDSWVNHVMTRSAGASYWYREASKKAATRQFKIQRNGTWYDCRQSSPGYMCTDVTNMNNSNNNFKLEDNRAGVYNNDNDYKILVFPPNTPANTTNDPIICASTSLPEEFYASPSGRKIYFDNSAAEWAKVYFRRGHSCYNYVDELEKVPGTDNLYQYIAASASNGYQAFQLANNSSWADGNSIYKVDGGGYAITKGTVFQKYALDEDVTFTPGDADGDPSDGCQYYAVTKTSGMKKDNVSITAPTNGTITVAYTSGEGGSITSGNVDLAHTSILTISASASTGYVLSSLTVNETAHTSGENYILSEDAVVAATFTPQVYTISYKDKGNVALKGDTLLSSPKTHTYGTATALKKASRDGYVFKGWYTNSACTGDPITSLTATDYTTDITLYADWDAMTMVALADNTLYKVEDMVPDGVTMDNKNRWYPGVSANNRFNIRGSSASSSKAKAGMCPRVEGKERTIDGVGFTNVYGFRKPASGTDGTNLGTGLPDNHAIQFKISGDGLLDIYCYYADSIFMVKDGGSAAVLSASQEAQKVTKEVTEGTYYLYSTRNSSHQRLYGLKFTPTYAITHSDATNGSYTIKVGSAAAVSTSTNSLSGETITLAATPSSGYVINGWNVTGATVGNNNIASTSFTMPASDVTVAPTFKLMPNVYYYQDGTRYASSTYKAPDGSVASSGNNQTINDGNEWTVSNSISGLTVSAKGCTYDGKSGSEIHETSYLKVPKNGDASNQYVKFVVAAGYNATSLKMKIGGYSSNPTVTLKPYTTELGKAISYTGTVGGVATKENNFNEISWSNLAAGTYYLNVSSQNAYISEITAQTESTGYVISFAGNGNTGGSTASHTAITSGADVTLNSNGYTKTGYKFSHWTANVDVTVNSETVDAGDPIEDRATIENVTSNIELTAQWTIQTFNVTFAVSPEGYGTVSGNTIADVPYNTSISTSSNSVTINGSTITATAASQTAQYTYAFDSWSNASGNVTAERTITANFTRSGRSYTVTLNKDGGTINPGNNVTSYTYGVGATLPTDVTKSGYVFGGWYDNSSLTGDAVTTIADDATGNKEYWAKWTALSSKCVTPNTEWTDIVYETPSYEGVTYNLGGINDDASSITLTPAEGEGYVHLDISSLGIIKEITITLSGVGETNAEKGLYYAFDKTFWNYHEDYTKTDGHYFNLSGSEVIRLHPTGDATKCTFSAYGTTVSISEFCIYYEPSCSDPTTAFANGTYTIGGSALDLSTLISGQQGDGTITYAVTDDNGTDATIAGTSFTATTAGTATVTATQAADGDYCEKVMDATITVIDPTVTPIIVYNLNVGTSAGTTLKSSVSTTDGTNITNITIDQTNDGADGDGAASASDTGERTTVLAIKTGANGDDWSGEPTNYELFKFTVGCGKKLTPSKVSMKVANKGGSSENNIKYKAVMSDTYGHSWSGTYIVTTNDGQLEAFQFTNTDPDVYFQGNVTLKLWAWTIAEKSGGGAGFRMGTPVQIFGVIADQTTPTATIRWTKQPAGGLSGTNETVTAVSSDGSAVTITSNNGSVATVAGSTVSYVGVGSTYLTASGTDACGNTMVSVNSDNFTVIGAYNLNYDANTGTGTMTSETGVHYAVVKDNGFTAPSGKEFYGWNTAANGSGDSYQPGDAIELNANTTLYAQWGTELTATWSVTKVDSKLYRGGGGYSVTVYLDDEDWNASGDKDDLDLTATEGVTLKNITKTINASGKAQVTADFDITTGVDADATSITFTLFVPATGSYASAELPHDEGLTSCAATDGEVYYSYTISNTSAVTNATTTGGTFTSYNNGGTLGSASGFYTLGDNGISKAYFIINTTDEIAVGDKIAVTTNNTEFDLYTSAGVEVADNVTTYYTVVADDGIAGTHSFKIGRHDGGSQFKTFTVTSAGSIGGITPTLSWETDLSGGVSTETGASDFTHTVTQDKNSLGAITYSSNNTAVATVNATTGKVHIVGAAGEATITATLAASGCFDEATATYTINVVDNCIDEPGTITSRDLGCDGTELTVSGHTATASVSYQWYKDGVSLGGSYMNPTCTVTVAGEYYVVVDNSAADGGHCAMASTNTVTVTAKAAATATKIVDSWYVKNGRRTPDVALVQSENAESFTVKSGSITIWESAGSTKTGFGGCGFHMDENGIIYLNGTKDDGSATTGLTEGDETLTITVNGCGGSPVGLDITIHKQDATDRKSVAFVVDGTKGGAFDADNESHSVNTALYKYLDYTASGGTGAFDLTAQNIYATTDEKAIREHYSQFDAILITDDPGTKETPSGDYKTKGYVNAFGTMVDVRPILTMEAYVSALANWKTKGITGEPTSPDPRQYALRLECKDHEIYNAGLPNPAPGTHVWDEVIDGQTYRNVILVDSTKSPYVGVAYNAQTAGNQLPALQGFNGSASGNLLGLGRISDGTLQAAIERQEEPAARLLVFSIQAKALPNALTDEGKTVVRNILTYLLKTNMEEVDDCSNYFTGKEDRDWANDGNWTKGAPTDPAVKARILAPCEINSGTKVHVSQVDIATGGKSSKLNDGAGGTANGTLTIHAGGALVVEGKIRKAEAPYFTYNDLMPMDDPERLVINTSNTAQAALIFDNDDADTKATVNLYSLGRKEGGAYQFQYMAVPMEHVSVNPTFADETHPGTKIYTYVWQENGGWERRGYYTDLYAFEGVGITTNSTEGHMDYTMTGNLASTATQEITLTNDGDGENIIGNSWMAPINIAALKTGLVDDANIVDKTVYIYMTGNDAADDEEGAQSSATATAGQWLAIPIDASGWSGWSGLKVIPAMQAYYIKANAETTLTLDYDNLVRSTATESLNEKLRAPRRTEVRQNDISGMRMRVADSKTHTDLYLFEDGQFSESYDNGWEAKFMEGDGRSAQFYALNGTDKMAVLATDELEGTFLGFVPGKESGYTISFFGGEGRYYLNDLKTQQSTLIEEGNNYPFTYEAGDDANRFLISRQPFGALSPTGCDTTHEDIKSTKIFYNGTLYIIRAGRIYSAEGMLVK